MLYSRIQNKKFRIILLFLFACSTLLFAACQPTPENEAIVNKNNSNLEEKVLDTPALSEEPTETNEKIVWDETQNVDTEIGECSITVSMDVDTPESPGPVSVYLIEPAEFSLDDYESVVSYLMPGEIYDGRLSKQDVTLEILNTKKLISEHTISDGYQGELDNHYNFLDEKYNDASEKNDIAKFEFIENTYGQSAVRIKSYLDDSTILTFTGKPSDLYFRADEINIDFLYTDTTAQENLQANGIETTYEQAQTIANNAMTTLFKNQPYAMVHTYIIDKRNYLEYLWSDDVTSLGQAYVFYYMPEFDGFPSLFIDPASRVVTEKTEYAKPYAREHTIIVVDDRGIVNLTYRSISDVIEKLNDDVKLMPFEEVLERFKTEVFHHYLWGKSADIEITQIEFGMVREPVKDNPNQYMMVPAWNFIGNIKSSTANETEKSILALSAIDGSIITDYETILAPK